jgi:ABC-2 type transport system permease protein
VKLLAFVKKDVLESLSYRFRLLLDLAGNIISLLIFYFIGKTFTSAISPYLQEYGNDFFAYVLVGIATANFVTVGLSALADEIRTAQVQGTLEFLLATPTSIYTILIGSTLWSFMSAFISAAGILVLGAIFLSFQISLNAALFSLLVLLLTFAAFLAIGMLSASFVIIFKQGNPIDYLLGWSSFFLGSVIFPVEVLPRPFQQIAQVLPITHAVRALRGLLLAESTVKEVIPSTVNLCIFIVVLAPLSALFLRFAVNRAKRDGNLVQY